MVDDAPQKLAMLRATLAEHPEHDALVLTQPETLSWLLGGARVGIAIGGPPVLAARITADDLALHVLENEAERIVAEELRAPLAVERVPWHASVAEAAAVGGALLDTAIPDALRALRRRLLPGELARYTELCAQTAAVLTDVALGAAPRDSERAIAARLAEALVGLGAEPTVLLVAGESRLGHRHPLPTTAPLGGRAMLVVCARRDGMVANATRWVRFGPADDAERDRDARLREIEADVLDALRPGVTLGEVLAAAAAAYPRHGFDEHEWLRHHQGGAAGYLGRDPRAVPGSSATVVDGQVFAWNPTVPGGKIEDTVLLSAGAVVPLTADARWPTVDVRGRARPVELER